MLFFSTEDVKIIVGMISNAGSSIQNQPHLLSMVIPHFELECLPYGATVFEKIRNIKVHSPINIQRINKL